MRRVAPAVVSVLLGACSPRNAPPPTSPPPVPSIASSSTTASAAPALPPLARGPDYVFVARSDRPKLKELPGGMGLYRPSPIRGVYMLENSTVDARVMTSAGKLVTLEGTKVARHAWSPSGARLATLSDGTVRVWDSADGKLLRQIEKSHARELTMPDDAHVHWFADDCRLVVLDVDVAGATPAPRGEAHCGGLRLNDSNSGWLVFEAPAKAYVKPSDVSKITVIDDASGAARPLDAAFFGVKSFGWAFLSPDGARLCFDDGSGAQCTRAWDSPTLDRIDDAHSEDWQLFDPTSSKYLLMEPRTSGPAHALVADFRARTVRDVGAIPNGWNLQFAMGDRVVMYGEGGTKLFDLEEGWSMDLFDDPKTQGGSAFTIPGAKDELVLTKAPLGQPLYFSYDAVIAPWSKP